MGKEETLLRYKIDELKNILNNRIFNIITDMHNSITIKNTELKLNTNAIGETNGFTVITATISVKDTEYSLSLKEHLGKVVSIYVEDIDYEVTAAIPEKISEIILSKLDEFNTKEEQNFLLEQISSLENKISKVVY